MWLYVGTATGLGWWSQLVHWCCSIVLMNAMTWHLADAPYVLTPHGCLLAAWGGTQCQLAAFKLCPTFIEYV